MTLKRWPTAAAIGGSVTIAARGRDASASNGTPAQKLQPRCALTSGARQRLWLSSTPGYLCRQRASGRRRRPMRRLFFDISTAAAGTAGRQSPASVFRTKGASSDCCSFIGQCTRAVRRLWFGLCVCWVCAWLSCVSSGVWALLRLVLLGRYRPRMCSLVAVCSCVRVVAPKICARLRRERDSGSAEYAQENALFAGSKQGQLRGN